MLTLTKNDVHVGQTANSKQEAIEKIAQALEEQGFVANGYVKGMLEREGQAATFLGSGIAIPHGTPGTRDLVKKTGVQVFCFPDGVNWGDDGEKAYIAIGIAARSNEHLTILKQLTHVLGDDDIEDRIKALKTKEEVVALLSGQQESDLAIVDNDSFLLNIDVDSLATMQALNASRLQKVKAVDTAFISHVISTEPTYLGEGIWLNDSPVGNLKNRVMLSRAQSTLSENGKPVNVLLTISAQTDSNSPELESITNLIINKQFNVLKTADNESLLATLGGKTVSTANDDTNACEKKVITILNSNGLHTRPASMLVKLIKEHQSKVTVKNLDTNSEEISGTSMMKLVGLGAKKGTQLELTVEGTDAKETLADIIKLVESGFGEGTE